MDYFTASAFGKLPNPKGRIAPHLSVGWQDPLDTKIKPNQTANKLREYLASIKDGGIVSYRKLDKIVRSRALQNAILKEMGFVLIDGSLHQFSRNIKTVVQVNRETEKRKPYNYDCYKKMMAELENSGRIIRGNFIDSYSLNAVYNSLSKVESELELQGYKLEKVMHTNRKHRSIHSYQMSKIQ